MSWELKQKHPVIANITITTQAITFQKQCRRCNLSYASKLSVWSLVTCRPPKNHSFVQNDPENVCQPSGGYSLVHYDSKLLS